MVGFILGFILFLVLMVLIGYFAMPYFQRQYDRSRDHTPPRNDAINDSNDNLSTYDPAMLSRLSLDEARAMLRQWKENGTIPSDHDFFELRRKLGLTDESDGERKTR